jgi:hypothetical protein
MQALRSYLTPLAQGAEINHSRGARPTAEVTVLKQSGQMTNSQALLNSATTSKPIPSIELTQSPDIGDPAADATTNVASVHHGPDPKSLLNPSPNGPKSPGNTSYLGPAERDMPAASRPTSRRTSAIFPSLEAAASTVSLLDIKSDMMVKWLYEQQLRKQYVIGDNASEGVVLKKARGDFTCCPTQMSRIPNSLHAMVTQMNVRCAMTVNTFVVRAMLGAIRSREREMDYIPLAQGLQVQIIRTLTDLPHSQLHHYAAFVEDIGMLVVWEDDAEKLLERAELIEGQVMEIVWRNGEKDGEDTADEKEPISEDVAEVDPSQLEDALSREHRPVILISATQVALTLALCTTTLGVGWRNIAMEIMVDGSMMRLALVAVTPVLFFVSLVGRIAPWDQDYRLV